MGPFPPCLTQAQGELRPRDSASDVALRPREDFHELKACL
jgi:hypothetical protein